MQSGLTTSQFQMARANTEITGARATSNAVDNPAKSTKHVPALDGIRGLAILLVLCFHLMVLEGNGGFVRLIQKTWGYGWAGVDLFFVLSGFLITGILLDAKRKIDSPVGFYKNFYARRTVRIFPLYYAFLIVFLLILPAVMSNYHDLFGWSPVGQWAYWTYTYNLFQGHHQSQLQFSHSLGVIWSLCIEEQFYFLWPTLVWFCSTRFLLKICGGLVVLSIVMRAIVQHYTGYEVFVSQWSYCRMDPLAVGSMIAILTRTAPALVQKLRPTAMSLLMIVPIALVVLNQQYGSLIKNPGFLIVGYTALALMFGSVLLMTITSAPGGIFVRVFNNSLLRLFGRLSYAMYLFNQPVRFVLGRYFFGLENASSTLNSVGKQAAFFLSATTITVLLALLSWHLFEKHFLKIKDWFPMDGPTKLSKSNTTAAPMPAAP